MQTQLNVVAIALTVGLSGCCAPEACYVAQSRFEELGPVIDQLQLFEEKRGYFPATLEDAFPNGLPSGISRTSGDAGTYAFRLEQGGFELFSYGSLDQLGLVSQAEAQDGTTDWHYALRFSYVGGGLIGSMNDCVWATNHRVWQCSGYM